MNNKHDAETWTGEWDSAEPTATERPSLPLPAEILSDERSTPDGLRDKSSSCFACIEAEELITALRTDLASLKAELTIEQEWHVHYRARAIKAEAELVALKAERPKGAQAFADDWKRRRELDWETTPHRVCPTHGNFDVTDKNEYCPQCGAFCARRERGDFSFVALMTEYAQSEIVALKAERAKLEQDARRYRRLQILGCAPGGSKQLDKGTVLCFTNLDGFVDADLALHKSRGEAYPLPPPASSAAR